MYSLTVFKNNSLSSCLLLGGNPAIRYTMRFQLFSAMLRDQEVNSIHQSVASYIVAGSEIRILLYQVTMYPVTTEVTNALFIIEVFIKLIGQQKSLN